MDSIVAALVGFIAAFFTSIFGSAEPPPVPPSAVPHVEVPASAHTGKSAPASKAAVQPKSHTEPTPQPAVKPTAKATAKPAPETGAQKDVSQPSPEQTQHAQIGDLGATTHVLANGNLALQRFSIRAGTLAESVEGITLRLTRYGGVRVTNIRIFVFSDSGFTVPVVYPDGKAFASSAMYDSPSGVVHESDVEATFTSPLMVPAGETRYILILGEVREVEDHPDFVTAEVTRVGTLSQGTARWWFTYDGLPKSEKGGYNFTQAASAAAAFAVVRSMFEQLLSWFKN